MAKLMPTMMVLWACGCLAPGPAPTGRHLLTGRDEDQVQFIPGAIGGPTRIVLSQAKNEGGIEGFTTSLLSTVDDPGPGGTAGSPRVLVDHVGQLLPSCRVCSDAVDARGRLYVDQQTFTPSTTNPGNTDEHDELIRVDVATGDQQTFGAVSIFDISTDRARIVFASEADPSITAVDLDGSELVLPAQGSSAFAGSDLFFIAPDGELERLASASHAPEALVADVARFDVFQTARGPLLGLRRSSTTGNVSNPMSLFDATALTEIALPPTTAMATNFVPSPSGRYIASPLGANAANAATLTLFDRDTNSETTVDKLPLSNMQPPIWRPQHEELWFASGSQLWRVQPGAAPESVGQNDLMPFIPAVAASSEQQLALSGSLSFTPDGASRVVVTDVTGDKASVSLRSADGLGPALPMNPKGTGVSGLWPLPDGRLLVEDWITDEHRNDVYLVDPSASTMEPFTSTGAIVATGRDRCLALLHWLAAGASGDLTLIDYATGAQTVLAQDVYAVAVDAPPETSDALAPGTRIVYLVRGRIASPDDGLWATEL